MILSLKASILLTLVLELYESYKLGSFADVEVDRFQVTHTYKQLLARKLCFGGNVIVHFLIF